MLIRQSQLRYFVGKNNSKKLYEKIFLVRNMYSERLKYLREEKEIIQNEMSSIFGLKNEVYGNYERENTTMKISLLINVCNYLECSLDYAFSFTNLKLYEQYRKDNNIKLQKLRLKELRKKHNLTQQSLADILQCSKSTISGYEIGKNIIATPFLYQICKKYNISADYLLGKIDNPKDLNK